MIETGSHIRYDKLIVAFCPEGEQIRRAVARDGITEAQAMDRIRRQMPIEEKLKMADFVIDTTGTPEQTKARAREVFLTLQRMQRQFQETAR
jgi:dephospho-CoA kinase